MTIWLIDLVLCSHSRKHIGIMVSSLQSSPFPFIFNIYKFHDTVQLVPLLQSVSVNNCPLNLKHKCTKYLFYDHTLYRVESVITKLILHRKLPSFPHCTPPKLFYRVAKSILLADTKTLSDCNVAGWRVRAGV